MHAHVCKTAQCSPWCEDATRIRLRRQWNTLPFQSLTHRVTSFGSNTRCASLPVDLDLTLTSSESASSTRSRPLQKEKRSGRQGKAIRKMLSGHSVVPWPAVSEGGYDSTPKGEVRHLCTIAGVTLPNLFHTMITAWGGKNWRMIA